MSNSERVAVIGAGPAGLMAAEMLSRAGAAVTVVERMPTPGRKFLLAGRGGLNLTHAEDLDRFIARYGPAAAWLEPAIRAFPSEALRAWARELGQDTFVGSGGRVFPQGLKASPLLRAWVGRLARTGVRFRQRLSWTGWDGSGGTRLRFQNLEGVEEYLDAEVAILALGGASWPQLGSDGGWVETLAARGVSVRALVPANCGFLAPWSETFRDRFAGVPLKNLALSFAGQTVRGEAMVTSYGIEGGAVYALAGAIRDALAAAPEAGATVHLDLRPDLASASLADRLRAPRRGQSTANFLRKTTALPPVAVNLLREVSGRELPEDATLLAHLIKALPLRLVAPAPIARAISSAGGVAQEALDPTFMLRALPGIFVAGEMLDWEAPTGGYLLHACLATGRAAGSGAAAWLGLG